MYRVEVVYKDGNRETYSAVDEATINRLRSVGHYVNVLGRSNAGSL